MGQTVFRVNLSTATCPMVSTYQGQTVVIPNLDESSYRRRREADNPEYDLGVPQVYYMENVMPETQGLKSVSYTALLGGIAGELGFDKVIQLFDGDGNRGLLGLTTAGKVYMLSNVLGYGWVDVTSAVGIWNGVESSFAYINGDMYVCLSEHGIYKVDLATGTLLTPVFLGITVADVVCITASYSYLIVCTRKTIAWSSTVNALDFVPSLISGAGGGNIQGLIGDVVYMGTLTGGFVIYSTNNCIAVQYSQNSQSPFIFVPYPNSLGIKKSKHIAENCEGGSNYAWTSGGLVKITLNSFQYVFPDVADFLSSRTIERAHLVSNVIFTFVTENLDQSLNVSLAFVSGRYLVVSYGKTYFEYALVYDTVLNRWGKLKVKHVCCFNLTMSSTSQLTYAQVKFSFSELGTQSYLDIIGIGQEAPDFRRNCCFADVNGKVSLLITEYDQHKNNAITLQGGEYVGSILLLGKYQLSRAKTTTIHGITVESVNSYNNSFYPYVYSSFDGKTVGTELSITDPKFNVFPMSLVSSGENVRDYGKKRTGVNHSILIIGNFNLTALSLKVTQGGTR